MNKQNNMTRKESKIQSSSIICQFYFLLRENMCTRQLINAIQLRCLSGKKSVETDRKFVSRLDEEYV